MRLFFYGTLMDARTRRAVLGRDDRELWTRPATLTGFRRVTAASGNVPVLIRASGHQVRGQLVEGLVRQDLLRIAHFEGRGYEPARATVLDPARRRLEAWIFLPASRRWVGGRPWDLGRWQRTDRERLLRRVARWMREPGVLEGRSFDVSWSTYRWIAAHAPAREHAPRQPGLLRAAE